MKRPLHAILLGIWGSLQVAGCSSSDQQRNLEGEWSAFELTVADSLWKVEVNPINLTLYPDQRYHLAWYGNVQETGKWAYSEPYLKIRPKDKEQRKLSLSRIGPDTLYLEGMLDESKTRIGFSRTTSEGY